MHVANPPAETLGWKKSFLWLALAVACFQVAYTSIHHPAAGLLIFGYAFGLVKLTDQLNVRRAFYFGLATGFLCYAPQLFFFFRIFNVAAIVLWLVLAFWVGLFAVMVCGSARRWGKVKTAWLIPIIWTDIEYFRSELYYLKFSWLNIGYALPAQMSGCGIYRVGIYNLGFCAFCIISACFYLRKLKLTFAQKCAVFATVLFLAACLLPGCAESRTKILPRLCIVGVQMEFPSQAVIPQILN